MCVLCVCCVSFLLFCVSCLQNLTLQGAEILQRELLQGAAVLLSRLFYEIWNLRLKDIWLNLLLSFTYKWPLVSRADISQSLGGGHPLPLPTLPLLPKMNPELAQNQHCWTRPVKGMQDNFFARPWGLMEFTVRNTQKLSYQKIGRPRVKFVDPKSLIECKKHDYKWMLWLSAYKNTQFLLLLLLLLTKSVTWQYLGSRAWYHWSAGVETTGNNSE